MFARRLASRALESLGARFTSMDAGIGAAESVGGYASEQSSDQQAQLSPGPLYSFGNHATRHLDCQIPGRLLPC